MKSDNHSQLYNNIASNILKKSTTTSAEKANSQYSKEVQSKIKVIPCLNGKKLRLLSHQGLQKAAISYLAQPVNLFFGRSMSTCNGRKITLNSASNRKIKIRRSVVDDGTRIISPSILRLKDRAMSTQMKSSTLKNLFSSKLLDMHGPSTHREKSIINVDKITSKPALFSQRFTNLINRRPSESNAKLSNNDQLELRTTSTRSSTIKATYSTANIYSPKILEKMQPDIDCIIKHIANQFHNTSTYQSNIDLYRIGKVLGKGSFGKVNMAMHKLTGKLVAIKSLNKKQIKDKGSLKKVMREIELLKMLIHPNIMHLYETFETEKHIILVTELCTGGDLLNYVRKRRKLTEEVAKVIFKQIIDGLHYIHSKSILHRDIKLDNILMNCEGDVKICDFGVSKIIDKHKLLLDQCGTPAYIAPEIILDTGYKGFASDIWSSGVVLYAMLYGTVPFKANSMEDLHAQIINGKYVTDDTVSREANNLVSQLLKVEPKKRIALEDIFKHPWFANYEEGIELLSPEEKQLIQRDFFRVHKTKEEDESIFTEYNLDTASQELGQNISSRSIILAPFNTTDDNSQGNSIDLSIMEKGKVICSSKVREINRQYERNNNCDLDNGIYNKETSAPPKPAANAKADIEKAKSVLIRMCKPSLRVPKPIEINDSVCRKLECFGFPTEYIVKSLRNNETNHATATYFLLLDEKVAH